MRIRDSVAGARAEQDAPGRQPRVRIIAPSMIGADAFVNASVRVNEDAYVLVVASDLDGRFRVVFPDSPDESGFVSAVVPRKVTKFFAGFGVFGSARYGRSAFSVQPVSRFTPRGVMVAIASDRPLQFERLVDRNGDWDDFKLEQLAYGRGTTGIGYVVGSQVALAGQEFDADYSGFSQFASPAHYGTASLGSGLCESEFTNAMYFDPPPATRYFERDGVVYQVITTGDACSGYQTITLPVNPDQKPKPRPGPDSAAMTFSASRVAARPVGAVGRFGSEQLDGTVARARRSSPLDTDGNALRPVDRPNVVGGLRFRPPEQLRPDPRLRDADGGFGARTDDGVQRRMEDQDRARRQMEAEAQRNQRPSPRNVEPPRPEPVRQVPPAVRDAPTPPPAAPVTPPAESSGKPRKE
ncbi:MAG: hypothetical protein ABI601_17320 [bacterium]